MIPAEHSSESTTRTYTSMQDQVNKYIKRSTGHYMPLAFTL